MIEASDTPCPSLSFLPGGTVCCDAHDEGVTRAELVDSLGAWWDYRALFRRLRHVAATIGVHPADMFGFHAAQVSLTAPARSRLRVYLREQRAAVDGGDA